MLNRRINKLRLITSSRGTHVSLIVLVAALVVVTTTNIAHAEVTPISIPGLTTLITDSLANLFYSLQTIASWLIYLAGALLNFSVNLTMHIKEFVNATPAVYTVWKAIRDISGMFIIFSLLYAAIMLIVSYEKPNYGTLIKNIVVAGVLINFSFFLTGLAIDVSNIVSIQLYNAIAPAQTLNNPNASKTFLNSYIEKSTADGGLSTIFMQSLGVTRLYNPDGSLSSTGNKVAQATQANANNAWATPVKIILIGVTSIIIMITAALSFFLASLAFIVRFVILIFLLAFSPILFASFVVPEIGKYATMWKTQLKNQLVFMPVYLLLMYFALSVLTSSSIFQNGYAGNLTTNGGFLSDLMVLAVNAVLVIVMLNAPLLGAMSMGAMVPKWADKFKAENIWKGVSGFTGRNTVGQAGLKAQNYLNKKYPGLANTLVGQAVIAHTAGAAANATWGGSTSATAAAAAAKARATARATGTRTKQNITDLQNAISSNNSAQVKSVINRMTTNEKSQLDKKTISNDLVLQHLDEGAFKAIDGNASLTDADRAKIQTDRMNLIKNSVATGNTTAISNLLKNASGATLAKLDDASDPTNHATIQDPRFIAHLRQSHLKDMDHIDPSLRKTIGDEIFNNPTSGPTGGSHPAYDYVSKNRGLWG